jgi:hypothetical protein
MATLSSKKSTLSRALHRVSITDLLSSAKIHIAAGEDRLRQAAEDIAAASDKGATQCKIAEAVGKSQAWVNGLLQWRRAGYPDTPFGPQVQARRERAAHIISQTNNRKPASTDEKAEMTAARAQAEKAKFDASAAKARAQQAKAEAAEARARVRQARDQAAAEWFGLFHQKPAEIHSSTRTLLIKALRMLGSDQVGERDSAALTAEKLRKKLGMDWENLIVPATETDQTKPAPKSSAVH